jgi:hypothetical protein
MENSNFDLNCPISLELMIEPISVPCCGRSFSRNSLISCYNDGNAKCPTCRENLIKYNFDPNTAPKNITLSYIIEEHAKKIILLLIIIQQQKKNII